MMKKTCVCIAILMFAGSVLAAPTINFDAVNLRPANDGSGYGYVEEYADQTGMYAQTTAGGQKVYYGTDYFNGLQLSSIDSISFSFKDGLSPTSPYSNFVITDGSGAYGIISSQGGYTLSQETYGDYTITKRLFYVAGNNGNEAYGFRFYEPVDAPWAHGTNLTWDSIKDWYLLGVGESRPLYSGEEQFGEPQARGPVEHGVTLVWGDSQDNYLGYREIFDVSVVANGIEYSVGVVPVPGAIVLAMVGTGIVGFYRRRVK